MELSPQPRFPISLSLLTATSSKQSTILECSCIAISWGLLHFFKLKSLEISLPRSINICSNKRTSLLRIGGLIRGNQWVIVEHLSKESTITKDLNFYSLSSLSLSSLFRVIGCLKPFKYLFFASLWQTPPVLNSSNTLKMQCGRKERP